jgi:hypothetical protein
VHDASTHHGVWCSRKKLIFWASICAVEIVLVGCWVGVYAGVVIAGSVASIAVMRRMLGLWAAYLTTIPIGAVGFFWLASHVGGPPQDLYDALGEVSLCLAFGAVVAGPVALGVTCFLQFIFDLVAATPQSAEPASENAVVGPPQ